MTTDPVLFHEDDSIGVITLNRPDHRNSMTPELLDAFTTAVTEVRARPALRCIVVTGRGRCFCAGADLNAELQRGEAHAQTAPERSFAMYAPFLSLLDLEIPVIAAINGHAIGGGFGLALVCDIRIGAREARYGANFTRLGLHPGMAVSYLLPRVVGAARAADLLFTGRLFDGVEAEAIGLLERTVAAQEVLPAAMDTARQIAANAPIAVRLTKRSLRRGLGWDIREAARDEAFAQAVTIETDDAREGIAALLGKRPPRFTGR